MTTWNKLSLYALLGLIVSILAVAILPLAYYVVSLSENLTFFWLSNVGDQQEAWVWNILMFVSAISAIASIYFGIVGVRRAETEKSKGKWLGILSAIASGLVLFSLIFSLTL